MNKTLISPEIETQVETKKELENTRNVYNYNINIGKKQEKQQRPTYKKTEVTAESKTYLDIFLEQKTKDELVDNTIEETIYQKDYNEELLKKEEYETITKTKSIMPIIGVIISVLMGFLIVYNAVSYTSLRVQLNNIENGITLQDGKISQIASKIEKLTNEEVEETLKNEGYERLPIDETETIILNEKNTPQTYEEHTNWFDFICNLLNNNSN